MKRIVIAPTRTQELPDYLTWLDILGVPYHIATCDEDLRPEDLLLLCGGPDISVNITRDVFEYGLIRTALAGDNKVVGICRGMQIMNVFMGGTLITELDGNSHIEHRLPKGSDGERKSSFHEVANLVSNPTVLKHASVSLNSDYDLIYAIKKGSNETLRRICNKGEYDIFTVNSRHHQCIKKVAEGLVVIHVSSDGIPESAIGENKLLVQWHPERSELANTKASNIIRDFIGEWYHEIK